MEASELMISTHTAPRPTETVIGYSALERFEECYEFEGEACYIADSPESLRHYLRKAGLPVKDYRLDAVKFAELLNNFGCAFGQYALEAQALARFEEAAKTHGLKYKVEEYKDPLVEIAPKIFLVRFDDWHVPREEELE
jgi:hypothetical protein